MVTYIDNSIHVYIHTHTHTCIFLYIHTCDFRVAVASDCSLGAVAVVPMLKARAPLASRREQGTKVPPHPRP